MDNAGLLMQVLQCLCNLCDDVPREVLAKVCETNDLVEELAAGAQLKDDVVVLVRLCELDELDNVGVVELAHNLDFLQDVCPLPMSQYLTLPN